MCRLIQKPGTSCHVISDAPCDSPDSDRFQYTEKAKVSAMSARKKRWICFFIVVIILIIIAVVIGIQVAQGNIGNVGKNNNNAAPVTTVTATPSASASVAPSATLRSS